MHADLITRTRETLRRMGTSSWLAGSVPALVLGLTLAATGATASSDFSVQRGTTVIEHGSTDVSMTAAALDYVPPVGPAFVRITGTRLTGMGATSGGGRQDADRWMVWISEAGSLDTHFTFSRYSDQGDTRITWELVEYQGESSGANAVEVRGTGFVSFDPVWADEARGDATSGILDHDDVVVFITGQASSHSTPDGVHQAMCTAAWDPDWDEPVLTRGGTGFEATVSYAVIELTGENWSMQRVEHVYDSAGDVEDEVLPTPFAPARTFLHAQHRSGGSRVDEQGAEVWLSDVDTIRFQLPSTVPDPSSITTVAWIVSNDRMTVQHLSGTRWTDAGAGEDIWTDSIVPVPVDSTSIMGETARCEGTDDFPHGSIGIQLVGPSSVELRQSDRGVDQQYRFSVVEWPRSDLLAVIGPSFVPNVRLSLAQNAPNPFRPGTRITFSVSVDTYVRLDVYDGSGRRVRSLLNGFVASGRQHACVWRGRDQSGRRVATGTYFYRLEAGGSSETRRLVVDH